MLLHYYFEEEIHFKEKISENINEVINNYIKNWIEKIAWFFEKDYIKYARKDTLDTN